MVDGGKVGMSTTFPMLIQSVVRLTIIGALLPSNGVVVSVSGLMCYECTGEETLEFCNLTASLRQCPGQEICSVQLIQRGQRVMSKKGCTNDTACQELESANDPGCLRGRVTTSCSWCCSNDRCNHGGFPEMQPDNNASEWMTTETPIPASLVSSGCPAMQNATDECLSKFQEGIQSVVRGNGSGFASFCRNIPEFFHCLVESSVSCDNSTAPLIPRGDSALQLLWGKLLVICPGGCNRKAALVCVLEVFEEVMTFLKNRSNSFCDDLMRKVKGGFQCVAQRVSSCEDGGRTMAANDLVLRDLESSVSSVCPRLPPTDDLGNDPQLMIRMGLAPCQLDEAMSCISDAGAEIIRNRIEQNGSDVICDGVGFVEGNMSCARSRSDSCVLVRRKRALLATRVIDRLLDGACDPQGRGPPSGCNTTAARLCIVNLMQLAKSSDVQDACDSVEKTRACVRSELEECSEEERQSMNGTLGYVLSHIAEPCTLHFQCLSKETVFLTEGGKLEAVEVQLTASPKSICNVPGCKVILDVIPATNHPPNCRSKSPISQFLVSSSGDLVDLCSRHMTADNWNAVQVFHLAAKIDFKYDNTQQRTLRIVMRKVVNGAQIERRTICKHQVVVIDGDRQSVCQSITDPHITTFDGRAYNNFLEGFFTLYRHKVFPYEVQVAFQRCVGGGATCNCAVGVRAGDSVFFLDKCRKKRSPGDVLWSGDGCGRHSDRAACVDLASAEMFYHEKITPGFRVFTRGDSGFELLLPHGTRVVIRGNRWYNVYVYPSPFDWNQTEGLCGTYDGQQKNDLTLRNGRLFRESLVHRAEPPLDFSLDWRVFESQLLLKGVEMSPFRLPVHCDCGEWDGSDGSPRNLCSSSRILELCDFNSDGEITFKLPKGHRGQREDSGFKHHGSKRSRRDLGEEKNFVKDFDVYDFDLNPDVDIVQFGNWSKALALSFCQEKLLNESVAIKNCLDYLDDFDTKFAVESCMEDLLLSGDTSFVEGALGVLKAQCSEHLASNVSLYNSEDGDYISLEIEESLCLEECGLHGTCFRGRCYCEHGFTGSSCLTLIGTVPGRIALVNGGLCDLSRMDCSWVVVVGETFINSTKLVCLLQKVQFLDDNAVASSNNATVAAVFISSHQVLCPTGSDVTAASYFVSVSNDGANFSGRRLFLSRDLECHDCRLNVTSGDTCRQKANTCLVSDKCYSSGEEHYNDPCLVCDPLRSSVELHRRSGGGCTSPSQTALTAVIVTLVVIVCLIAVALVFQLKRKTKRSIKQRPNETEKQKEPQQTTKGHGSAKGHGSGKGHDNFAMETIPE